jgi:hypothetical protein
VNIELKMCAHRGSQRLRRPGLCAIDRQQDLAKTRGGRAAQDRTDIAGILNAIEQHRIGRVVELARRHRQRTTAMMPLGVSTSREFAEQRVGKQGHRPAGGLVPGIWQSPADRRRYR